MGRELVGTYYPSYVSWFELLVLYFILTPSFLSPDLTPWRRKQCILPVVPSFLLDILNHSPMWRRNTWDCLWFLAILVNRLYLFCLFLWTLRQTELLGLQLMITAYVAATNIIPNVWLHDLGHKGQACPFGFPCRHCGLLFCPLGSCGPLRYLFLHQYSNFLTCLIFYFFSSDSIIRKYKNNFGFVRSEM